MIYPEQPLIDTNLLQQRFYTASKTYNQHAIVQQQMATKLVSVALEELPFLQGNILELGCGTGLLTCEILKKFNVENYIANDLVNEVEPIIKKIISQLSTATYQFYKGDATKLKILQKQDTIWSGACIQWIQDLDSFFYHISSILKQNGYFALSSFDINNFLEIKSLTGMGIDYLPFEDVILKASKHFKIINSQSWFSKLWFDSPIDILKHMRYTGVNGISSVKWGKKDLENFTIGYNKYKEGKRFSLTYNPFILILKKL